MTRGLHPLRLAGLATILPFCLVSCSRSFDIAVSGFGRNIRLEFWDGRTFFPSQQAKCVKELSVSEYRSPNEGREVWAISAPGDCVRLTGIDIGHVPIGFEVTANLLPLEPGRRYLATAYAEQEYPNWGQSLPWFVCKAEPAVVKRISDRKLSTQCVG